MTIKNRRIAIPTLLALILSQQSEQVLAENSPYGDDLDYLSLTLEELGKIKVSIATGDETTLDEAPAIASVITAADIEAMGFRDLNQVLQTVPGLHVSVSPIAYTPIYTFRGIRTGLFNPQILMLINGIPITSIFTGDRGVQWGGYPIENIARIEVIRGPGSALYGADAYAGVINIVTKTAQDINKVESGIRAGSFGNYDTWFVTGYQHHGITSSGYLSANTTDGQSSRVNADAQTTNDSIFGTSASEAPGSVNTAYDGLDGHFDIANSQWQLRTGLNYRDKLGAGAGVAQALDPTGEGESLRWTTDLTYRATPDNKHWDTEFQLSTMYYHEKSSLVIFPAGTDFSAIGGGSFPNGMIGNPEKKERHYRTSLSTIYKGIKGHKIRIGAGYALADLYEVSEYRNYRFNANGVPEATGFNNDLFTEPRKRELGYVYLQDEWAIASNLALTTGVRHDEYSDFGSTTNPRIALVWQNSPTVTTKLLYGKAFRAPAFTELYNNDNPVADGNADLKPERITSSEAAISWRPREDISFGVNIFHYKLKEIIRYVPNGVSPGATADNTGEQSGRGLEMEFAWDAASNLRIQGNYAHQKSKDDDSGEDSALAPENVVHLRSDWRFSTHFAANLQIDWVADRRREADDIRDEIDDYTLVNFSLRTARRYRGWGGSLTIFNLFDEDAREPSSGGSNIALPDDLPLAGRSIFFKLDYQL